MFKVIGLVLLFVCLGLGQRQIPPYPTFPVQFETNFELVGTPLKGYAHFNTKIGRGLAYYGQNTASPQTTFLAYDIDNAYTVGNTNCRTQPLNANLESYWLYPHGFPYLPPIFINESTVELPTGPVTCNWWRRTYYGECGDSVPPPCASDTYFCVTSDNIPVKYKLVDKTNGNSFEKLYWNVQVIPQADSLFEIPSKCNPYPYPDNPPFGLQDTFEDGTVADFWIPCGNEYSRWECGHIYAQSDIVRSGNYAANITVQPGDISERGDFFSKPTERDELDSRVWYLEPGTSIWFGLSFYVPEDFPIVNDRLVMGQWKQFNSGDKHPLMAMRFVNGTWYHSVNIGEDHSYDFYMDTPLELGVWHDMIYNIKFSPDYDGYFRAFHNGVSVVNYGGITSYSFIPQQFYHKFGLYRDKWPTPWTIFFDNYAIGSSWAEVDPSRFD